MKRTFENFKNYINAKFYIIFGIVLGSFFISHREIFAQQLASPIATPPKVDFKEVPIISKFVTTVVNPLITMLFGLALAYFVFGVLRYVAGGNNEEVRQKGRDHILWGLLGAGIMLGAWAILALVTKTFSIDQGAIGVLKK